jgi:predicted transposase YbfD/YdcC
MSVATGCQLKNCDLIVEKQGHYLVALKKIPKHIYEQVSKCMEQNKGFLSKDEWTDFGGGRVEKRTCYVENHLQLLDGLQDWQYLKSVVMIEATREKNGKTTHETRFYSSDLVATAKKFNHFVRNHWRIENRLHWKLDVVFREDQA